MDLTPFLLFAIIVFWTPPHFWSLAIFRRKDYERAGIAVIPARNTPRWITISSFLLVLNSFWLVFVANMGILYSISSLLLGIILLIMATHLQYQESPRAARYLYLYSIFYLIMIFCALLVDRILFS